ncbi:MAG: tetratricopeptide repeat protein [Calditrichae bacterium]|nr:tetratricopeptide repeat protein [Calditrichia bacterium]
MIGTLTSNVRDQQPFVDIFSTPELESPWKQQYQSAQELFNRKEFREALQAIDQSIAIDSLPASQYFLEGKIFEALGQTRQAYQAYYKAKDYDGLRFRASEDLNRRIERMTEQDGVTTVPVKETFEAHSANGIPGSSLILEHLHPNLDGYKLMAKTFADAIVEKNYLGTATHKNLPDSLWENQIAITEIDREVASLRIRFLKSGWPFTDHAPPAMEEFDTNLNDILNSYAQQFWKNEITWEKMHVQAGQYYVRQKDWQKAELEYRALVQATPMNYAPYEFLSRLLIQQNKIDEAKELLLELIEINPTPHAYKVVGSIYLKRKKVAQAVSYLEKAVRWTPDDYQAQYHLAQGYTLLGRYEEAWRAIQVVLQLNEDYQKARELASFIKTAREKESLPGDQPPGSVLDPGQ